MEAPPELHRRPTLSHFMSVESSNLRDLLKLRQDDAEAAAARRRGAEATRTLATILACEKRDLSSDPSSSVVTRTLLDIIRDEQEPHHRRMLANGAGPEGLAGPGGNRGGTVVNWKAFRDRLRLRRAGEGLAASPVFGEGSGHQQEEDGGSRQLPVGPRPLASVLEAAAPADPPPPDRGAAATTTGDDAPSTSRPTSQELEPRVNDPPATSSNAHPQPPPPRQSRPQQPQPPPRPPPQQDEPTRVSLMALLEQADRTGGGAGGPSFAAAVVGLVDDGHGEQQQEHRTAGPGAEESMCCVCMVRNKGAAFIPCGHTFCRLCTRELWVSRGTCPLCNGFILEILDIF